MRCVSYRARLGALVLVAAGCSQPAAPARPTTEGLPTVPPVSIQAPVPVAPADGTTVGFRFLTVANAARTGPVGNLRYEFEVATNSAFFPVASAAVRDEGPGETSFEFPFAPSGMLAFWRVRAVDTHSGLSGAYSTVRTFTPPPGCATWEPTELIEPADGALTSLRLLLTARTRHASGTPSVATHRYEISTDRSFRTLVASGDAPVPVSGSFRPPTDLAADQIYYWRARVHNLKVCTANGDFSPARSFVTSASLAMRASGATGATGAPGRKLLTWPRAVGSR
jgi:hypothetical protein